MCVCVFVFDLLRNLSSAFTLSLSFQASLMGSESASSSLGSDDALTGLFAGQSNEHERDRRFRRGFLLAQEFGNRVQSDADLCCFCQAFCRDYTSEPLHEDIEVAFPASTSYGWFAPRSSVDALRPSLVAMMEGAGDSAEASAALQKCVRENCQFFACPTVRIVSWQGCMKGLWTWSSNVMMEHTIFENHSKELTSLY